MKKKKRILVDPINALLTLAAFTPVFVYSLRFGLPVLPLFLSLLALLALEFIFNTVVQTGWDLDRMADSIEGQATRLLNSPLMLLGNFISRGNFVGPGPTRNIQANDKQQCIFYSWGFVLIVHFGAAIGVQKLLYGMHTPTDLTHYYPLFVALLFGFLADILFYAAAHSEYRRFSKQLLGIGWAIGSLLYTWLHILGLTSGWLDLACMLAVFPLLAYPLLRGRIRH